MIIVLEGADFSQNNIGKVSIERELNPLTKELLSKYSKVLTTDKKNAVDDFITAIYGSGLSKKITCLLMPCLATTLEEAMINAIDYEVMGSLNPEYWSIENAGLKQSSTVYNTTDAITYIDAYRSLVPVNQNHFLFFNSSPYEYITSNSFKQLPLRRNSSSTFYDNGTQSPSGIWLYTCKYNGVSITTSSGDGSIFPFGQKNVHIINTDGSELSVRHGEEDKVSVTADTSIPSDVIPPVSFCAVGNACNTPHSILSFGYALTDDEQLTYARLVKDLMTVLLE